MSTKIANIGFLFAVVIVVFSSLLPFIWFLDTSLKSQIEVTAIPPKLLPSGSLHFYQSAIKTYDLLHYVKNSMIVAGSSTLITLLISVFAGYSLARLRIKYKGIIMGSLLLVSMFPQISIAGPVWKILQYFGWLNTYQGLILRMLPSLFLSGYGY